MLADTNIPIYIIVLLAIIIILIILLLLWMNKLKELQRQLAPHHFTGGQITLLAEHDPDLSAQDVKTRIDQTGILDQWPGGGASVDPEKVLVFNDDDQAFSLITVDVPKLEEDQLLREIERLNRRIEALDVSSQSLLRLRRASPNWLAASSSEHNGHGGPGAQPVEWSGGSQGAGLAEGAGHNQWDFTLPASLGLTTPDTQRGRGVEIFILDTAPCCVDLQRARDRWANTNQNQLLDQLLNGPNKLDIIYAGYSHLLQVANYFLPNDDYVMADHGLFIAGIIHSIAPLAKLHLVEVLNPFGVGTLTTIAHGFKIASDHVKCLKSQLGDEQEPKVLVNASLFIDVPANDQPSVDHIAKLDMFWRHYPLPRIVEDVGSLQMICEQLYRRRAAIIAAAGNDGDNKTHPEARFPAAFDQVLGVGALKGDNQTPTGYSNKVDRPESSGIATIGGDTAPPPPSTSGAATKPLLADQAGGILGVYTGLFPGAASNDSGWARWSGTSFSTPIITGIVAALMSETKPGSNRTYTAQEAIAKVRQEAIMQTAIGPGLKVTQP
jgi:hypothetical protein